MYGRDYQIPGHNDMHDDNFENEGRERLIYDLDKLITAHHLRDIKIKKILEKWTKKSFVSWNHENSRLGQS